MTTGRRRGRHGPSPLSGATRRRLLAAMLARAEAGDNAAAEALVRLGMLAQQRATNGSVEVEAACEA